MATWDSVLKPGEEVLASFDNPTVEAKESGQEKFGAALGGSAAGMKYSAAQSNAPSQAAQNRAFQTYGAEISGIAAGNAARKKKLGDMGGGADVLLITNKRIICVADKEVVFEVIVDPEYMKKVYDDKRNEIEDLEKNVGSEAKGKGLLGVLKMGGEIKAEEAKIAGVQRNSMFSISGIKKEKPFLGSEQLRLDTKQWRIASGRFGDKAGSSIPRPWIIKFPKGDQGQLDKIVSMLEPNVGDVKNVKL